MRPGLSLFLDNTTERGFIQKKRKHKRTILVTERGGWKDIRKKDNHLLGGNQECPYQLKCLNDH